MALSIGFRNSVSFLSAIQATGLLTFAPVGLSPTEHASLRWTHLRARLVQSRAAMCASVVIIEGFSALSSTLLAFGSSQGHQGIKGLRETHPLRQPRPASCPLTVARQPPAGSL